MLGDEKLVCEQCGTTSVVTFWRFEGLSCHGDRNDAGEHVAGKRATLKSHDTRAMNLSIAQEKAPPGESRAGEKAIRG